MTTPETPVLSPRAVALAFWEAQGAGDRAAAERVLAPDVEWVVAGRGHDVAGTYIGHGGFFDDLLPKLASAFEPGSFNVEIVDVYEDPARDTAITHFRDTAVSRNGYRFDLELVAIMAVRNGRIHRVVEIMDLGECARAFTTGPAAR